MRDEVDVEILWVNETCFIWYLENHTIWLQEADNVIQVIHGCTKTQMKLVPFIRKQTGQNSTESAGTIERRVGYDVEFLSERKLVCLLEASWCVGIHIDVSMSSFVGRENAWICELQLWNDKNLEEHGPGQVNDIVQNDIGSMFLLLQGGYIQVPWYFSGV